MEKTIWTWFAVAASICGVFAMIGWSATIYAFVNTPNIHEVILSSDHGNVLTENKASALFFSPIYQTALFFMTLYPTLRYDRMIRRLAARIAPRNIWQTGGMGSSFTTVARVWCVGMCVLSCINLYWATQRVSVLLHQF